VERHRELDRAEARGEVAASGGAELDQLVAQLARDLGELRAGKAAERARIVDRAQKTQLSPPAVQDGVAPRCGKIVSLTRMRESVSSECGSARTVRAVPCAFP
jgi:hypothetical protein